MLLLLVLSASLLGSAVGFADATPDITAAIVSGLEGAEQTVARELKSDLQRVQQQQLIAIQQQQLTAGQQQKASSVQLQKVAEVQQQLTASHQQLATSNQQQMTSQQQQAASQQQLMTSLHQLTEAQQQPVTSQQQLTEVQQQLTEAQQQPVRSVTPSCPTGWVPHSSNCYLMSSKKATWHQAERECTALDVRAHLVSVHQTNKDHVASLVAGSGVLPGHGDAWIGLSRLSDGDSWGWTDDTPLNFTNWWQGQPDNNRGVEDCVVVDPSSGTWFDDPCSNKFLYMCQVSLG